jgi:hypothetical protein
VRALVKEGGVAAVSVIVSVFAAVVSAALLFKVAVPAALAVIFVFAGMAPALSVTVIPMYWFAPVKSDEVRVLLALMVDPRPDAVGESVNVSELAAVVPVALLLNMPVPLASPASVVPSGIFPALSVINQDLWVPAALNKAVEATFFVPFAVDPRPDAVSLPATHVDPSGEDSKVAPAPTAHSADVERPVTEFRSCAVPAAWGDQVADSFVQLAPLQAKIVPTFATELPTTQTCVGSFAGLQTPFKEVAGVPAPMYEKSSSPSK